MHEYERECYSFNGSPHYYTDLCDETCRKEIEEEENDCCDHYYSHLCTEQCKQEQVKVEEDAASIVAGILDDILATVDEVIDSPDLSGDYYTRTYGVVPWEWRDELTHELIGLVYESNSEETRRLWGDSLTVRFDDSDEDEEYDYGEDTMIEMNDNITSIR